MMYSLTSSSCCAPAEIESTSLGHAIHVDRGVRRHVLGIEVQRVILRVPSARPADSVEDLTDGVVIVQDQRG